MGDELRGESLVHLNVRFSTETELKEFQDLLYEKSGQGISFTGLLEAMVNEATIVTAVHNIKSNKGSKTAGVDGMSMDRYLQMPRDELITLTTMVRLTSYKFIALQCSHYRLSNVPKSLSLWSFLTVEALRPLPYTGKIQPCFESQVCQTAGSTRADTPLCADHLQMGGVQERGEVVA